MHRLHQEDAAQILGLNTDDPARKFQFGKGLPSLAALALRLAGIGINLERLLALTTFNLAIGNVDAHAKNISVLHLPDGHHRLAPAYDVAMHLHQGTGETRFAMDVAGESDMNVIGVAHLVDEAVAWGMSPRRAMRVVTGTATQLHAALRAVDRAAHPGVSEKAWKVVEKRVAGMLNDSVKTSKPESNPRTRAAHVARPRRPAGRPGGGRFSG